MPSSSTTALADAPQEADCKWLELLKIHERRVIRAAIYDVQNPQKNSRFACEKNVAKGALPFSVESRQGQG